MLFKHIIILMWDTEIEENFKFGLIDILILKLLLLSVRIEIGRDLK